MVEIVKNNIDKINEACKIHHVKALYIFGSAARIKDFTNDSDVDFVVEYNYKRETNDNNVFERVKNADLLKEKLKTIINREIDLIQEKNIRNKYLNFLLTRKRNLYMAYRDISVWLEDLLISIERIKKHIEGIVSYSEFIKNQLVIDATERNLEIIAEALKNAIRLQADLPVSETKKIIGLRNVINHVYYEIEYDSIWVK